METVTFIPLWRHTDHYTTDDVKAFWARLRALPSDVSEDQRAENELCAAAYAGDELVGVSSAAISFFPLLRCRLAFYRCLVSPQHRRSRMALRGMPNGIPVAIRLTMFSRELLERWSKQNTDEKVLGMAAILEPSQFEVLGRRPIWRGKGLDLRLIAFTPTGRQIRVSWFAHARFDVD